MKADQTIRRHRSLERASLAWPTIWKHGEVNTARIVWRDEDRRRRTFGPIIVAICLDARRVLLLQPFQRDAFDSVAAPVTSGLRQR